MTVFLPSSPAAGPIRTIGPAVFSAQPFISKSMILLWPTA
jgi:hypothetical protein